MNKVDCYYCHWVAWKNYGKHGICQGGKINEIVFDSYPGLAEYIEVDCKDLQTLHKVCKSLDLDYENYKEITLHDMYFEQYGFHLGKLPKMKSFDFVDTYKNINKYIQKNKNIFKKLFDEQRKYYID